MSTEVTDEMRVAVLAEQVDTCNHVYDLGEALVSASASTESGMSRSQIGNADETRLPHIRCSGPCGQVWLVIDSPGSSYGDAVVRVAERFGVEPEAACMNPVNLH